MWRMQGVVLALFGLPAAGAFASQVTYHVDPARSVLVVSGTYGGAALETLSWGSTESAVWHDGFTTSYEGTIVADRDVAAGSFRIMGGAVAAQDISGVEFGAPQTPCNYSFFAPSFNGFSVSTSTTFSGQIRDFSFSLGSPALASAASFDASEVSATATSGRLDWEVSTYAFTPPLEISRYGGVAALPGDLVLSPGVTSLSADGAGGETLVIPIDTVLAIEADGSLQLHLSGNIVAVSVVPEPGAVVLWGGLVPVFLRKRRGRGLAGGGGV